MFQVMKIFKKRERTYDGGTKYSNSTGSMTIYQYRDGSTRLYSYGTLVLKTSRDGYIICTGTYSNTTRRHINTYLANFADGLTLNDLKDIIGTPYAINTKTKRYAYAADHF